MRQINTSDCKGIMRIKYFTPVNNSIKKDIELQQKTRWNSQVLN